MMMDIAWGLGVASAPSMTGFGSSMGTGFPDSIPDDEMEGMIDSLGFFQDKDDIFDIKSDKNNVQIPQTTLSMEKVDAAIVSPKNLPIASNDTGAVVTIPEVSISTPRDVRSLNFATSIVTGNSKDVSVALPQPPQLASSSSSKCVVQSVLNQQRETILRNRKIIEAQQNELQGKIHEAKPSVVLSNMISPTTTNAGSEISSATYPLARAALKKADEQIIHNSKIAKGTKRKAVSLSNGTKANETNAYQKWKLTPAGATKLKAAESSGIQSSRNITKQQEDMKNLTSAELEIRRERNRKHAKKSRLRKKSLTSELEQSLEALRDENIQLRKLVEAHIAKKKAKSNEAAKSVESMLEKHRVRSHERFIECLIANSGSTKSKRKSNDSSRKRKIESKSAEKKILPPSGRGIIVDDKTLKVLKGLSKSVVLVTNKPQQQ